MKLYTRAGDQGMTQIIGPNAVSKADVRVEAYGTIDELNSYIGLLASLFVDQGHTEDATRVKELVRIQHYLFDCGTDISAVEGFDYRSEMEAVNWLEERIDYYSEIPDPITQFVLPGGNVLASHTHIARTVCRRAERCVVQFIDSLRQDNTTVELPEAYFIVLKFLNRLSDYLFALARVVNSETKTPEVFYERGGDVFR